MSIELTAGGIVAGMPLDMSWYGLGVVAPISVESNDKFTSFVFEGDASSYTMYRSTTFKRCSGCAVWVPANISATVHAMSCEKPRCSVIDYSDQWDSLTDTTRIVVRPITGQSHTGTYKSHVVEQIWAQLRSNRDELYIPIRNR